MIITGTITGWFTPATGGQYVFIDERQYLLAHLPSRFYTEAEREAGIGTLDRIILDGQSLARFETAQFPDAPMEQP